MKLFPSIAFMMLEENVLVSMLQSYHWGKQRADIWRKLKTCHCQNCQNTSLVRPHLSKCFSLLVRNLNLFNPNALTAEVSFALYRRPAHIAMRWRARRLSSQKHCRDGWGECLNNAALWKGLHFHVEWLKVMKKRNTVACLFAHWIGRLKRGNACRAGISCAPTAKVMSY